MILRPCTAPALGAALAYVGARGNLIFDASVLFVFSLGMGTLMLVLGAFGGVLVALPRSGQWMIKVKQAFGAMTILLAEYLLVSQGEYRVEQYSKQADGSWRVRDVSKLEGVVDLSSIQCVLRLKDVYDKVELP